MSALKSLIAAAALATGLAGAASAAPALNAGVGTDTATSESAATPVYHFGYSCYPVYRWVYTFYGWQQVYAGQRCPGYYGYPYGYFRYSSPGVRIGIGF